MSSTGRKKRDGSRSKRRQHDYYPTPEWVIAPIVDHLIGVASDKLAREDIDRGAERFSELPMAVIDPFAGDGSILHCVAGWLGQPIGYDIDKKRVRQCQRKKIPCKRRDSFKSLGYLEEAQFLVTNPPYKDITGWIYGLLEARARMDVKPIVALLLPIPFFESKARQRLHLEHPSHAMILSERISFTGNGKTDSVGSAWFVWGDGLEGQWSIARAVKPVKPRKRKGESNAVPT